MKLHLHQLLSAVLLASLVATPAYTAEIPSGYEIIDFRIPEILSNYASNTEADYYAFKLYVDVACTPSTSPEWSETSPLVSGGNLIFTSADADNTASLIFSYGDSPAFNNVNSLKFDTFTHLKFTDIDTPIYDGSVEYVHDGGAINLADNGSLVISGVNDGVEGTSDVVFCGTLCIYGGVISAEYITMIGNGDICCSENVGTFSGIIDAGFGCVTMNNNNSIRFSENSPGNCIYTTSLTMNENSSISFIRNSTDNGSVLNSMIVSINNNDCVVFSENKPTYGSYGNMISGGSITMKNNGSITFSDNSPLYVVAMYTTGFGNVDGSVMMSDNGSVIFSGNTGSPDYCPGGAIYGRFIFLRNNDYVLFEKNAEIMDGVYRLRSVCIDNYSSTISEFSAAAGKKIEFRDSVYVGGVLLLNADYTDEEGVVHKQQGDIIFTGATTEADLLEVKGSSGTAEEILASRTSKVAKTEIYGGRLRVEDGAIYQGQGITAHAGTEATVLVKNATLSHSGYDLTFNAGTTLELVGSNSISGNLNLLGGSTLHIDYACNEFTTNLNGSTLALSCDAFLRLTGAGNGDGKTYTLFTGVSGLLDAQGNAITLDPANNAISDYFDASQAGTGFWANGTLHLNNGTLQMVLHNETVKETLKITTRQVRDVDYRYYDSIIAKNIVTSSESSVYGAVLSGELVNLSNIGKIEFTGNSNFSAQGSACGGGIYGGLVTMNHNGCISFTENSVSTSQDWSGGNGYYAAGGAMEISVGELCNNGRVEFIGNSAIRAGAIYITGNSLAINDNGSVAFIGNKSREGGGAIHATPMDMVIELSRNGSVIFSGNQADLYGGAIYPCYGDIRLNDNGIVRFDGNIVYESNGWLEGGAISTEGKLSICNNDNVLFEKNVEKVSNLYRLRSIYLGHYNDGDIRGVSLSAAAEKFIEFRDSVYINVGHALSLNADYEGTAGKVIKQTGDIIFTGKYAEAHLNEILEDDGAGRGATVEEIQASRTTEVNTMTNLYGGRLRVKDSAVYQGQGITAHEASEATVRVKDAELSHAGYNLEFNAGTALEVAGNSTIRGNVNLKEGSLFKLEQAASLSLHETVEADAATLTVNGGALLEGCATLNASLTLADGATLDMDALDVGAVTLNGALTFGGQVTMGDKLLGILSEMSGWEESVTLFTGLTDLVLPAVAADDAADRLWVGDVFSNLAGNENYYFNYVPEVGSLAVVHVPEPTTTSLGLAALVALAARRRRK